MALVQPLLERDGGCFATAWELALGVLERDDSSSESSLWRHVSAVHDSVPALVEHLASGCHGDAVASAPSTLPFLALLPVDALTSLPPPPPPSGTSPSETPSGTSGTSPSGSSETSPAASIVAATWEGWRTCCTPSRSNDAAALLRAHAEATLYCVLVAAKKASDPRRFREVVLDASIATRWAPEALRADPASRSDVRTTLCDALATLSARAELTRATDACWDAVARASVELMRGGECGGGVVKIDAAGAARCRAFHAELLAAAERKRPGGDATWVNDRYATPIARVAYERASRANANAASARLSAAAASTLAALVTAHGVTCLGDGASASEIATRCLAASDDDDDDGGGGGGGDRDFRARAALLAAAAHAAAAEDPASWDAVLDALSSAENVRGARVLAAATLNALAEVDDAERWRRPALDALVARATSRGGDDATVTELVVAARGFTSAAAATTLMRDATAALRLRSSEKGGWAARAAEHWAWPPPADADAEAPWIEMTTATFASHLFAVEAAAVAEAADEGDFADASSSSEEEDDDEEEDDADDAYASDDDARRALANARRRSSERGVVETSWTRIERAAAAVRLLPIRPRSRGARRSLRTFPVVTLHPRFPFNVRLTGKTFD